MRTIFRTIKIIGISTKNSRDGRVKELENRRLLEQVG